MNLDDILDSTANSVLEKPKPAPVPAEIKPWLASSANVPKEIREKWTRFVKIDRNAKIMSRLQPSNSYRSWDSPPLNTSRLLNDLVRKAATTKSFDEPKTSKFISILSPVVETEFSKQIQTAYAEKILSDVKEAVLNDPNYDASKFPNLARVLAK